MFPRRGRSTFTWLPGVWERTVENVNTIGHTRRNWKRVTTTVGRRIETTTANDKNIAAMNRGTFSWCAVLKSDSNFRGFDILRILRLEVLRWINHIGKVVWHDWLRSFSHCWGYKRRKDHGTGQRNRSNTSARTLPHRSTLAFSNGRFGAGRKASFVSTRKMAVGMIESQELQTVHTSNVHPTY